MPSDEELAAHHVLVPSDSANAFRRVARLRQALWREGRELPIGTHRGRPLGSRLAMPFARETLANYLTDGIREVVRKEVGDAARLAGKMYGEPRIWEDLLSSQPLCFNLFGELAHDHSLASRTFARLLGRPGLSVTGVAFEHSPGRGDLRFTGDHSAFDVFVTFRDGAERGFVGIEVKYVEDLAQPPARHRPRYDEVAAAMGIFREESLAQLRAAPLEQLWRDHLLAGSLALDSASELASGTFGVIWPSENTIVGAAITAYRSCLSDPSSFGGWTLEEILEAIESAGAGDWACELRRRYLAPK